MFQNRQALASRERAAAAIQDRLKRLRLHFSNGMAGKAYNSHICIDEDFIRKIETDSNAIPGLSIKVDVEKISDESLSEITGSTAPSGAGFDAKSQGSTHMPAGAAGTALRERTTQAAANNTAGSQSSTGVPTSAAGTALRERTTQAVANNTAGSQSSTGVPASAAGSPLRERTTQAVANNTVVSQGSTHMPAGAAGIPLRERTPQAAANNTAGSQSSTAVPTSAAGTSLRERTTQDIANNSAGSQSSTAVPASAAGTPLRERTPQAVANNTAGSQGSTHMPVGAAGTPLREQTRQTVANNSAGSQGSNRMTESAHSESSSIVGFDTQKILRMSVSDTAVHSASAESKAPVGFETQNIMSGSEDASTLRANAASLHNGTCIRSDARKDVPPSVNAPRPATHNITGTVSNVSNKGSAESEMTKVLRDNRESFVQNSDIEKAVLEDFESPSAGTSEKSCISLKAEKSSGAAATATMNKPAAENVTHTVSDRMPYAEPYNRPVGKTNTVKHRFVINMSGKVSAPGDFRVTLKVTCSDPYLGEIVIPLSVPVVFNADPRSLWVSKPTSERVLFYKPDCDSAFVSGRSDNNSGRYMCMVAASQRGRQHAKEGIARDDHFSVRKLDLDNWYVMVVADGAGSSKFSRRGSEVACNRAVNAVNMFMNSEEGKRLDALCSRTNIDAEDPVLKESVRKLLFSAVKSAADEIQEIVNVNKNCDFRLNDFATTLLLAVFKHREPDLMIMSYAVGDGAMASVSETADSVKLLAVPDEGQYSGQTVFLTSVPIEYTSDDFISRCNINAVKDTDLVFLMTDGISDPMFEASACLNRCENWKSFLNKFSHGFPDDEIPGVVLKDHTFLKDELLKWLDFWVRGNHDDRTIAVMFSDKF